MAARCNIPARANVTNRGVTTALPGTLLQVSNSSANLIFNGHVDGPNILALTKAGPGTLTFGGNGNDNSGLYVSVTQGILVLGKTNSQNGHAVSSITNVSPGALLQMGSRAAAADRSMRTS